ncbi:MAG: pyrroline-5-carboxylate reductase [Haliscomenobacter sp.]|uniref:pyrroline-5-carboxylate reductase n=1 Tax=Haliscomenobacter sp. TaxID=2717303 RepID=UPI0029AC5176|nr:pyrroline-5-carboxylate reductase [Haliscomenobacter sp.]MDX2069994.1 pyrroline-5-carboxylate reductase [Haliscomenobacter sp.]
MNILIIGGGNMGMTFAKAFINSHVVTAEQLMMLEKDKGDRILQLKSKNIARIYSDPAQCVPEADLIILAVKPQDAQTLFEQIADYVDNGQVILSIMAGVKIKSIQQSIKVAKIIRAMPNLPAQIGQGMTAFVATEEVSRFEQGAIQNLLATTGKTLNVDREELIDVVTAISGSGPAYIYYFMDSMINGAIEMGIKKSEAELLVLHTFLGALSLYQAHSYSCNDWIQKVASKGGTTEAAIKTFNDSNLHSIIILGVKAALKRAIELGE